VRSGEDIDLREITGVYHTQHCIEKENTDYCGKYSEPHCSIKRGLYHKNDITQHHKGVRAAGNVNGYGIEDRIHCDTEKAQIFNVNYRSVQFNKGCPEKTEAYMHSKKNNQGTLDFIKNNCK